MVKAEDLQNNASETRTGTVAQDVLVTNGHQNSEESINIQTSIEIESYTSSGTNFDSGDSSDQERQNGRSSRASSESWQTAAVFNHQLAIQVNDMLQNGTNPADVLRILFPQFNINVSEYSDNAIIGLLSDILDRPPVRQKLPQYNTLEDAIELFRKSQRILILTGAGVSVSCGIPDFRSKDGIYARLHEDFPDLPDPTSMFDIRYFRENPAPFFNFAREIFPGQFTPSVSHRFIKLLEDNQQLRRNYTQNIDTLEFQTGIERVVECHGSFSKATCTECQFKYDGDVIKEDVLNKRVAYCKMCKTGVIKPDIVFFGEDLAQDFHRTMTDDKDNVDLLVVIGSSLKVRPVALIPFSVDPNVPQILINREPLSSYKADIELLGNCDDIIREICFSLGGKFAQMIDQYDSENEKRKKEGVEYASRKRRFIKYDDFVELMTYEEKEDNESKRPRLDLSMDSNDQKSEAQKLMEARFVNIEKKLPPMTCAQVSSNQTVFPGAELNYDVQLKNVYPAPLRTIVFNRKSGEISSDDDSCCSSDLNPLERSTSVDNLEFVRDDDDYLEESVRDMVQQSDSCPPSLAYEASMRISSTEFKDACQFLKNQHDQ